MNIDFSFDFHIRKIHEIRVFPAWILDFSNQLHRLLGSALWMLYNLLILQ